MPYRAILGREVVSRQPRGGYGQARSGDRDGRVGRAAPRGSGQAASAQGGSTPSTSGFAPRSPWWSDALSDPWRDPQAPAIVKVSPSIVESPPLETEDPTLPVGGRRGLGLVFLVAV